jgi:FlaA1/EpsC-like NDP-sugar epimerase
LHGESGDTIVPKNIKSYRIADIASYFSLKYNKPIEITGVRPGEKLHEMLISFTEGLRTEDKGEYYVIRPTYADVHEHVTLADGEFESSMNLDTCSESLEKVLEEQVTINA